MPDPAVTALAALVVAGLALVGVLLLLLRTARLARAHRLLLGPAAGQPGAPSFAQAVERLVGEARTARSDVESLRRDLAQLRADVGSALRHVAVVRFDAFGDTAGRQSFSAALLDDAGDGLVLTSITGRTESRTYCKGVAQGACEQPLSPEEQEALQRALGPQRPGRAGRTRVQEDRSRTGA